MTLPILGNYLRVFPAVRNGRRLPKPDPPSSC